MEDGGGGVWGFLTPESWFEGHGWDRGQRNQPAYFAEFLGDIDQQVLEAWSRFLPSLLAPDAQPGVQSGSGTRPAGPRRPPPARTWGKQI